jgi:hypothetical protein
MEGSARWQMIDIRLGPVVMDVLFSFYLAAILE